MPLHVVLGAGPIGSTTALMLAEQGKDVRLITRGGGGPDHPGIERVQADASDPAVLTPLTADAGALYQCASPPYHHWTTEFPPLIESAIRAAEASGAVLVSAGNLYSYGLVSGPMTEDLPARPNSEKGRVRAGLWAKQLAAHEAGRIRTAEVRGSDYLGARASTPFTIMLLPALLRGRRALAPADIDAPHSWTYTGDVARTLIAVAADESTWGRPWHVPTPPPLSLRELAELAVSVAAAPRARIGRMPNALLRAAGLFNVAARQLPEMRYQFDHPFVLDSSAAQKAFGLKPTSTTDALRETISALQNNTQ